MLNVNTSMLYQSCWWWRGSASLMPTLLAQPQPNFLSFFFMSTIINESNNNCFGFFMPWLTMILSSSCPSFSLYLSCLLYFYFLSWRDDVLQWCHIHNLHSTTYVHNHTNTMWVYFASETLCLLRISFRMPIYFKLLIFFLYLFLSFLFGDSSCFSCWSVVICRQETGRFRQEDHHPNCWRSSYTF